MYLIYIHVSISQMFLYEDGTINYMLLVWSIILKYSDHGIYTYKHVVYKIHHEHVDYMFMYMCQIQNAHIHVFGLPIMR